MLGRSGELMCRRFKRAGSSPSSRLVRRFRRPTLDPAPASCLGRGAKLLQHLSRGGASGLDGGLTVSEVFDWVVSYCKTTTLLLLLLLLLYYCQLYYCCGMIHGEWVHVSRRSNGQEWDSYMGGYTCDGSHHVKRYMYVSDMAEEAMGRYCRPRIRGCIALHCVGWLIDELLI